MRRALAGLASVPKRPRSTASTCRRACAAPARAIVDGDALVPSISAASIIAKVARDRLMMRLGAEYPRYGFERHMGYGTPEHRAAIVEHGPTRHHRYSFGVVKGYRAA